VQLAHERRVHGRGGEVELAQRLHHRELGVAHAVGRGPALHIGELRRQEFAHDPFRRVAAFGRQRHDLVEGRPHAPQPQLGHQVEDGVPFHQAPPAAVARSPS
jgi:hypothetical protein